MILTWVPRLVPLALALVLITATPPALAAQDTGTSFAGMTGEQLYEASCANCHGVDGSGVPQDKLGFDTPPADFSDCNFASREPDGDWIGVAHEGGPLRVFSNMMPAFGDALTADDLQRVMDYVRTLCGNDSWPRGDLNMPRPMVTEKAYPEDELVWTSQVALDGPGAVVHEITYEKRFWARGQVELVVPFGSRNQVVDDESNWSSGLGDVVLGYKHALLHSLRSGSILSGAAELKLPTGSPDKGLGGGTSVFEMFLAYGQLLPLNSFVQLQGIMELPFDERIAEDAIAFRMAAGTSLTEANWGRTWTPMMELLYGRELALDGVNRWELVPQLQVTLNKRQHIMANVAVRIPVTDTDNTFPRLLVYFLWDWFDGGLTDGW